MPTELPLRCDCGRVRGVVANVSPSTGNRMICYCDDCQSFAWFLDRVDVLDEWGGTDVFQVAPATVRITDGVDQLRCVRQYANGSFRWYAGCCRTPIANTVPSIPFVGIIHRCMDHRADGRSRDDVLGPPVARVHGRYAVGTPPATHPKVPLGILVRVLRVLVTWIVRGQAKPSPFFDAKKRPLVEPRVLSTGEREAIRERMRQSRTVA